jgi:predicted ATPase/Tfp pilus assembly protein PilF
MRIVARTLKAMNLPLLTPHSLQISPGQDNNFWYVQNDADTVIVFVHGIFSNSRTCWLWTSARPEDNVFWPDLIRNDPRFGHPSIYLAGFFTAVDAGYFPIVQCAREVFEALEREGIGSEPPVLAKRNVVFVCHSTGGIVVRYLLERNRERFRDKGVGLVLIASPSLGSVWANIASLAAHYYNQHLGLQLRWRGDALEDIHSRFRDLVHRRAEFMPGLDGAEAAESQMILRSRLPRWLRLVLPSRLKVVNTLSAGQYFGDVTILPNTDHFSAVKPNSSSHPSHIFLVTFFAHFQRFLRARATDMAHQPHLRGSSQRAPAQPVAEMISGEAPEETAVRTRQAADLMRRLPIPPTPLIGRTEALEGVVRLLESNTVRLLVLNGPGGSGKTRLAIEATHMLIRRSSGVIADGVVFVPLALINDSGLVLSSIAQAFEVREEPGYPLLETLASWLGTRALLILLDNFEHVIAAATIVAQLLGCCPRLKVLVTSRAALRLRGETEYSVPPLSVLEPRPHLTAQEASRSAAVELFVERMRARKPEFALTNENASAVMEICMRLDGLPLAIELAAARGKLISPTDMLARLDRRFDLLRGGHRDLPLRQQTLHGAVAWSYELLDEEEKALFRQLSVFSGGFTLKAAEAICPVPTAEQLDLMTGLELLLDKSLLSQRESDNGEPYFSMLESIHEFGLEQLALAGESDDLHRAHASFMLEEAETAAKALQGAEQSFWLCLLEREHANFRAALAWCRSTNPGLGLQLAGALSRFWWMQGHLTEGRRWLDSLLTKVDISGVSDPILARAHIGIGTLAWCQSDFNAAYHHFENALQLYRRAGERAGEAASLNALGLAARGLGNYAQAWTRHEESLNMRRALGLEVGVASSLNNLGVLAQRQGDIERARAYHEESLQIRRNLGDHWGMVLCLNDLGNLDLLQGEHGSACSRYEEAFAIARKLGDRAGSATALAGLASIAQASGDFVTARTRYLEALTLSQELGDRLAISRYLWAAAHLAMAVGLLDRAVRLAGAAQALRDSIAVSSSGAEHLEEEQLLTVAQEALNKIRFAEEWSAGRAMTPQQALACVATIAIPSH